MLLGAARYLAATRQFDGTLNLIFQPAEEGQGGAEAMLADGLLERFPCDGLFGMHNMPGLPAGHLGLRVGPMMASQDLLTVTLEGVGGHGSMPHLTVDPLVAAASMVMALQTVVARNIDTQEAAVVTVGALQAGQAANVIPQQALLRLSLRALNPKVREQMLERVNAIIQTQAASFGCTVQVEHRPAYPVLVNHAEETEFARQVGIALLGVDISPWLAAAIALTLFTSAYLAEIWRGCVDSIAHGQWEASASLALNPFEQLRYVILPQALRIAVAPTVGFSVQVVKGTAVTSIIGFTELTKTGGMLANATFEPFMVYGLVALGYFLLCYPLSLSARYLERRLHASA